MCFHIYMFPPTHYLYISITSRLGESVCTLPHAPHAGHGPVYVPAPPPPLTTGYRRAELVRYAAEVVLLTNSAAILLVRYLAWPENVRWTSPSGRLLGFCSHFLSICPRARRSTSARATDSARKRAFGNRVAAWPKLAPDRRFGYI